MEFRRQNGVHAICLHFTIICIICWNKPILFQFLLLPFCECVCESAPSTLIGNESLCTHRLRQPVELAVNVNHICSILSFWAYATAVVDWMSKRTHAFWCVCDCVLILFERGEKKRGNKRNRKNIRIEEARQTYTILTFVRYFYPHFHRTISFHIICCCTHSYRRTLKHSQSPVS